MFSRIFRGLLYLIGMRPARYHNDLQDGIKARWWYRMEGVNHMFSYKTVSPYRIVR